MKHFEFNVTLSGYGKTAEEAWRDAIETLDDDPGEPGTIVLEEPAYWYVECDACAKPFTEDSYNDRHTDDKLEYHEECCPICHPEKE